MCHISASNLSVNRLGCFHLHTCPRAMIFCGKRVARLEARISYLVDSRVIHVHEFPLINVLVFTFLPLLHTFRSTEKYQRDDGGKQHLDHDGKATTIARQGHPSTALKALYCVLESGQIGRVASRSTIIFGKRIFLSINPLYMQRRTHLVATAVLLAVQLRHTAAAWPLR
jgi:hypothetical protein